MHYIDCDDAILELVQREEEPTCPDSCDIFKALTLCPLDQVRVVILGQDPYHGGQAHGLAFSVKRGHKMPPSLRNIFKELADDTGKQLRTDTDLSDWAKSGVLLLNSILTVRRGAAASHRHLGWESYTDKLISQISSSKSGVVFMLWGAFAKKKVFLIDKSKHLVLEASHPSPLSANKGGWFGCKHFTTANAYIGCNVF